MKKLIALIGILSIFAPSSSIHSLENTISSALSRNVINRLRTKYIPMYKKYQGVESNRQLEIKTYNEKNGTLLKTEFVNLIRKEYFYKEPEVEVLKYIVDGKEQKASKYKPLKSQPGFHVFDESGDNNYETQVVGYKTIDEHLCYEIAVTPKKATDKHYHGKLYYRVKDLKLVFSSGSIGKISFPLKGLHVDLIFDNVNDLMVVASGVISASVDIPIIFPNRKIISRFKVLKNTPII
jgi:hypothetical protein